MNAASAPYCSALLITMSMSYSRYFSTAIANAASRQTTATSMAMVVAAESARIRSTRVTPRAAVASANHLSWSRSSPVDLANRTMTASTHSARAVGSRKRVHPSGAGVYTR